METYSINSLIEKIIKQEHNNNGGFPSHEKVVKILERDYPEAVDKYLSSHRTSLLGGAVTRQLTLQRNQLRKTNLATRLLDGTADSVFDVTNFWATPFYVHKLGIWKTLGELTGPDHAAIAERYEIAEVAAGSRGKLHRRLAAEVGDSTTQEVFDPKRLIPQIDAAYDTSKQLPGGTP